jgi:uncharacterized membrane protein
MIRLVALFLVLLHIALAEAHWRTSQQLRDGYVGIGRGFVLSMKIVMYLCMLRIHMIFAHVMTGPLPLIIPPFDPCLVYTL